MSEEVRQNGTVLGSFNTTFVALIPKVDKADSFGDFRSISLYSEVLKGSVIVTNITNDFGCPRKLDRM